MHFLSIVEIGRRYRSGTLTPRDYVEHLIARVKRLDGKLNAFLHLDERAARADADKAGAELAKGHDRGAFHGIPVGIKDIVAIAGDVTTAHSRVHDPKPETRDAAAVAALRHAGAFPSASSPCTNMRWAAPPSICPPLRRAIHGIFRACPAARRAVRAPLWPRV